MEQQYSQEILALTNPSFKQIQEIAKKNCGITCPGKQICKPWQELNHGVDLLDTHEKLCKYLCAYGDMHEEKMMHASESVKNQKTIFNNELTIIDWGCGQGLASVCFFDYLNQNHISHKTKKVILIEPSGMALNRAELHINTYLKDKDKIVKLKKHLNDVSKADILTETPVVLHFFSNILDIPTVDTEKLANTIQSNLNGEHFFICAGPMNYGSTRIEQFVQSLDFSNKQIVEHYQGKLNTKGTIKLLIFKLKGKEIDVIKMDFYPPTPNNINYIFMINKILAKVDPKILTTMDKIIQFYKTVIELEQYKEPTIEEFYSYSIINKESDIFSLDLQHNDQFHHIFLRNKDVAVTRWPKDLFIGLQATLNNKSYLLLHYIIPFSDITDIDTHKQQIKFKLSDFSIDLNAFEKLEFSEEQILEIEDAIKHQSTIDGISSVLKAKIDESILVEDKLQLGLSQKNPALSQIYSELNKLNSSKIKSDSLLEDFLLHKKIENQLYKYKEEDFIQISNLDDSQKRAVQNSFNSKLSVITGPPGSGKTQVILNILANAVLYNKKILVASKNNKAVDNVKDRFDKTNDFGYFLRFGAKKVLSDSTLPTIEGIINNIALIEDNSQKLEELKNQLNESIELIKENKNKLAQRDDLLSKLPKFENAILELEDKIIQLNDKYVQAKETLLKENKAIDFLRQTYDIKLLDGFKTTLTIQRNNLESKYSGLRKLWFNWFEKQKYTKDLLNLIEQYPFDIKNHIQKEKKLNFELSQFKKGDDILILYQKLIAIFSNAMNYLTMYLKLENDFISGGDAYSAELANLNNELVESKFIVKEITNNETTILQTITQNEEHIKSIGKPLLVELIKDKLKNSSIVDIINYKDYLPNNIPWKDFEVETFSNVTNSFLDLFNITSVTSLSAKNAFPLVNEIFDMVIIDEASQCDIASAIPLILRAKQLVVIGDPLQLKHISKVNGFEESHIKDQLLVNLFTFLGYHNKSLYDYCKDLLAITKTPNNVPIMLDKHYRCHPHIINYSNETFYTKMLGSKLTICTNEANYPIEPKGIVWVDVQGDQRANNININDKEVAESIRIATQLASKNHDILIGIVTPFKNQAEQINQNIPDQYRNRIVADTVHKFQGDEKDVMIYSLVVTNNSPSSKIRWIDESVPNLVNVAVTRAKNTLYIVGNKEYIKNHSSLTKPLGKLLEYVERK